MLALPRIALSDADTPPARETREILAEADRARGNLEGVTWTLRLVSSDPKGGDSMLLEVRARSFDVLATTLEPARSKGEKLLIRKENMWFHKPDVSKPVPISKRQKLLGQAAYGDIATTDYAGDYAATWLGNEQVDGRWCWIYDLRANSNNATYDRIKYWIDQRELTGLKAEYFTVSGKLFKTAFMEYDNRVSRDGGLKPFISRITILGRLVDSERTVLTFTRPTLEVLPDYIFDLSLMP